MGWNVSLSTMAQGGQGGDREETCPAREEAADYRQWREGMERRGDLRLQPKA